MRKHSLGAVAALALTLTLALTGCGSGDDATDNKVASGGDQASASTSTGGGGDTSGLSRDEKSMKFAQCLRENGINVPDPEPGKGPMIKLDPSSGVTREQMDKAMAACKQYSPQGEGTNPQQEENGRKYAVCMRENGVEKFPDPKPGQRGIMIDKSVGEDPDMPKAQQACQSILAGK